MNTRKFAFILVVSLAILLAQKAGANTFVLTCASRMGQISTMTYVNLIQHLAKEKNAIAPQALREFLSQSSAPNPMDYVSANLSSEDRFSFGKAFAGSSDIDWDLAKKKLEPLVGELDQSQAARDQARADTSYIFAPIPPKNEFDFSGSKVIDAYSPTENRSVLIRYVENQGTYLIDLVSQRTRLVSKDVIFNLALLKMADGRILIAYKPTAGAMSFVVEDGLSGDILGVVHVKELFPELNAQDNLGLKPHLFEVARGEFRLILNWPGFQDVLIFDSNGKHHFKVKLPENTSAHFTSTGRILAYQKISHYLTVVEVFEGGSKTSFAKLSPLLTDSRVDLKNLQGGRTIAILTGQNKVSGVYDIDFPYNQIKVLPINSPKVITDPSGQLNIFNFENKKLNEIRGWVITINDFDGKGEDLFIGPGERGTAVYLNLKDGRRMAFVMLGQGSSDSLYMVDLSTKEISKAPLHDPTISYLAGAEELEDGRILGLFQGNRSPISGPIKALQLFGPLENEGAGHE